MSETYIGIVTGQTAGNQLHGPASAMAYKVYVNVPQGPHEIVGIAPVSQQWPDTIDVVPLKIGTAVLIANVAGKLQMTATMLPYTVPCSQSSASILGNQVASLIGLVKSMTAQQKQIVAKELGL